MFGKDESKFLKLGPFWYPKDFYEIHKHHLLTRALRLHFESSIATESYDYLLEVKNVKASNMYAFYQRFIKVDAPQMVNVGHDTRQEVIDAMEKPADHRTTAGEGARRAYGKVKPLDFRHGGNTRQPAAPIRDIVMPGKGVGRKQDDLFDEVTNEVWSLTNSDLIGADTGGKFWKSAPFQAIHGWRIKRYWRNKMLNRSVPADQLAEDAFRKAAAETSNTGVLAALGTTAAEWEQLMSHD